MMLPPTSRRRLAAPLAGMLCIAPAIATAQPAPAPTSAQPGAPAADLHVAARLISEQGSIPPEGGALTLGIVLEVRKGWHVYWDGRNDSGVPVSAQFTLPAGFVAGPIQWPAPTRHVAPGDILDHVYEGRVTLLVPLTVPAGLKPGSTVTLRASVNWLVCNEACIPESSDVQLTLAVGEAGRPATNSSDAESIRASRARLPIKPPSGAVRVSWTEDRATVTVPGAAGLAFYPAEASVPTPELISQGETKTSVLALTVGKGESSPERLAGVLEVRGKDGKATAFYSIDETRPPPASAMPPQKK